MGLSWWLSGKESACQRRRQGFEPWFGKTPHTKKQQSPRTTLLSPCATTAEAHVPESTCFATREASPLRSCSTAMKSSPYFLQLEKSPQSNEDSAQPKINQIEKKKKTPKNRDHNTDLGGLSED